MRIGWIRAAERRLPKAREALGALRGRVDRSRDWHPVSTGPFNRDVEMRDADQHGLGIAPFPGRQTTEGGNADLGVGRS